MAFSTTPSFKPKYHHLQFSLLFSQCSTNLCKMKMWIMTSIFHCVWTIKDLTHNTYRSPQSLNFFKD